MYIVYYILAYSQYSGDVSLEKYLQNTFHTNTVIPRLTSDPANEFFG